MTYGLPMSDVENGNFATVNTEEMGILADFLPEIEIGQDEELTFSIVSDVLNLSAKSFELTDENDYDKEWER